MSQNTREHARPDAGTESTGGATAVAASAMAAPVPSAKRAGPLADSATARGQSVREWIREHDDKWPFVVTYLAASILLSILISLFWLLVVVAVHFLLEVFRQAHLRRGRANVLLHAVWEVKLDIGLAALAFAVALYVDVLFGILGIQSATRVAAATRIGARAAAWERNLRTFLLSVDEITRVSHAAYMLGVRRRKKDSPDATAPRAPQPSLEVPAWSARWGWGDRIGVTLAASAILLIVLAPLLTSHDVAATLDILRRQLEPFPS
jgi:hypothetical protein